MSSSVLYMSVSVDGFVAGPNDGPDNGLGDDGHRLHAWTLIGADDSHHDGLARLTGVNREVADEMMASGAVVVGHRTFGFAGGWNGDHHDGVPIFVLARTPPEPAPDWPAVTYLSDVARAMELAKQAAGDRNVMVHGAVTARLALAAGVLDEIQLHVVPVLLGQGRLLFDDLPPEHVELELLRTQPGEDALHLRYRVRTGGA